MYKFEAEKAERNVGEEFIIIERNSDLFSLPLPNTSNLSFSFLLLLLLLNLIERTIQSGYFRSGYSKSKNLKYENLRV